MKIKTVIAEEEVLARQKLRQLLQDDTNVEIVGEGANALETIDLVQFTNPDLILLDVQMPEMDGFDIVSALSSCAQVRLPKIIFTTAHDKYAIRAFEINAVDYLLKPFTRERLKEAFQRARDQLSVSHENGNGKKHDPDGGSYATRLVFKYKGRILFLPMADIRWMGAG